MIRSRPSQSLLASAALSLTLLGGQAQALDVVLDPSNLAQNVMQAARALEQINHQIEQIEQQARMLARSPLQLSPDLTQSVRDAEALFEAAQGLSFEAHRVSEELRALYPQTWDEFELGEISAQSDRWLAQSRTSVETAIAAEARALEQLRASRGRLEAALQASAGAEGQTGALQAGNQMLGVQAAELAEIQALLAAQGRALEAERMERLARESRAGEIQRRAFPIGAGRSAAPARSAF